MELIKDISLIVGCILSVISLMTIFIKAERKFLNKIIEEYTEKLKQQNLREDHDIKDLYERVGALIKENKTRNEEINEKFAIMEEYCKQGCRNTIKDIYYSYRHDKKIPLYERKTADYAYDLYHSGFHANSYGSLLYNEIIKWEIIPDDSKDQITEE